jgi:hypothetical protein
VNAVFACAADLLVDAPLFALPVLFLTGAMLFVIRSERRRALAGCAGSANELAHATQPPVRLGGLQRHVPGDGRVGQDQEVLLANPGHRRLGHV